MLTLSVRQPYAELILRGVKTVEFRSKSTSMIGRRFWLYACKRNGGRARAASAVRTWSTQLSLRPVPEWMAQIADALRISPHDLPCGVIVGSAVIDRVTCFDPHDGLGHENCWRWHLASVERMPQPHKPRGRPQPMWWYAV